MNAIAETVHAESTKAQSKIKLLPWLICTVGAVFYGYEYFLRISPSVMTTQLMLVFNVSAAALGNLSAFYYYAYTPMQLPVGVLMDRFGPRRLLTMACLVCAVGSWIFATTDILSFAEIGRFLVGFGSAFAFVGVLKLATIWFPPERFATVAGLASGFGTLGAIAGDVVLTHMVQRVGWKGTIYITAVLACVLTLMIYVIIRNKGPSAHRPHESHVIDMGAIFSDLRQILKNPLIWVNGLFGCLVYVPTTALAEMWGIRYLESAHTFSSSGAALAISGLFLGWGLGAPIAGWISDKIRRRTLPMIIGAMIAAILMGIILYWPGLTRADVFGLLFLLGMSYSVQVIVFAYACEVSPQRASGSAIAVTNMLVMLGGAVFQPVVGYLLDWRWSHNIGSVAGIFALGDFKFALAIVPISLVLATFLPLLLKETYCQQVNQD